MTNAVLLYTGNVCSTPMVDFARGIGDVYVPALEHFDRHKFVSYATDDAAYTESLSKVLDVTFGRQDHEYLREIASKGAGYPFGDLTAPHVFFKMRVPDPSLGDRAPLAAVFARHKVRPVTILRRSVVEQATKMVMSIKHYGHSHMQFHASRDRMSDADFQQHQRDLAAMRVYLDAADIRDVRKTAFSILNARRTIRKAASSLFGHKKLDAIITEDVFRPQLNADAYKAAMSRVLLNDLAFSVPEDSNFRKSGPDIENCANFDVVKADPVLRVYEFAYQRHILKLNVISVGYGLGLQEK